MPDHDPRPTGSQRPPPGEEVTGKYRAVDPDSTGKQPAVGGLSGSDAAEAVPTGTYRSPEMPVQALSGPVAIPGYDIVGELGRGGMGIVYKAWHVRTKRFVAIKMILAGADASDTHRKRFLAEAEAVARLSSPNIIQLYETGEHQQNPFFVLEFCGGSSLAKKLSGNPMQPQGAAVLIEKLARAVQVAHSQQVVHRDLKPANVLLSTEGEPKISDFGLAKRLDSDDVLTRTGAVIGTPSYMPPEQAVGSGPVGPPADIYALGAILYECLTGRPPFKSATAIDTLDQVRSQPAVPPRLLNASVPEPLDSICLKCLSKRPEDRYSSAADLADDLRRFLNGTPIRARKGDGLTNALKWFKERPLVASLLAIASVATVACAVIGILSLMK